MGDETVASAKTAHKATASGERSYLRMKVDPQGLKANRGRRGLSRCAARLRQGSKAPMQLTQPRITPEINMRRSAEPLVWYLQALEVR